MRVGTARDLVTKLLGNSVTTSVKDHLFNGPYVYPILNDTILENIKGDNDCCKVVYYLEDNYPEVVEELTLFKDILGNGNYNPNKDYKLIEYFIDNNNFGKIDKVFTYKQRSNLNKCIVYVGDKGSGKTATQNCWLEDRKLDINNNNIVWVRCDGYKLYSLWEKHLQTIEEALQKSNEDRRITLNEYLDVQLCYVFCKYSIGHNNVYFENLLSEIKDKNEVYQKPISRDYPNTLETKVYDEIVEINKNIMNNEDANISQIGYSYAINEVLTKSIKSAQFEKKRWIKLSNALTNYLTKNGYWLLKIVDGIDNVHINKDDSKKYYKLMLSDVREFTQAHTMPNELRMVAMREGSYNEMTKENIFIKDNTRHRDHIVINHSVASFKDINKERNKYATRNILKNAKLTDVINKVYDKVALNANNAYHNNVRVFLNNNLTLCMQILYRMDQIDAVGADVTKLKKQLEIRNYFLNGRLYLCTKQQWPELNEELGTNWFNIFYFDLDKYPCNNINAWYGMCATRVLQLTIDAKQLTKHQLTETLVDLFEYPRELVNEKVDDLRAFGMLDTKLDDNNKIQYIISKKGITFLTETYSQSDALYYYCLDSPVPDDLVVKKLINGHNNKLHKRTHYPFAVISTVFTFLTLIAKVHDAEMNKVKINANKNMKKYNRLVMTNVMSLPFAETTIQRKLLKNMMNMIHAADSESLTMLDDFINKYRSFIRI